MGALGPPAQSALIGGPGQVRSEHVNWRSPPIKHSVSSGRGPLTGGPRPATVVCRPNGAVLPQSRVPHLNGPPCHGGVARLSSVYSRSNQVGQGVGASSLGPPKPGRPNRSSRRVFKPDLHSQMRSHDQSEQLGSSTPMNWPSPLERQRAFLRGSTVQAAEPRCAVVSLTRLFCCSPSVASAVWPLALPLLDS
ncbi:hypothetical protein NDU88_006734 [Pleurodeles waltl]|uniref:Uncharacterized protein n=1 Tax=Pleurodeles waltl TaxID=8319 RepID=A0AAV7QM19_PLEWA|nr:hypothetical protein NDU88_006734 [Pleurodeles waltl]